MIDYIKIQIMSNWNAVRWIRLLLAAVILYQAWESGNGMIAVLGMFFLMQVLLNVGCCSSGGCYAGTDNIPENEKKEIDFTEIRKENDHGKL